MSDQNDTTTPAREERAAASALSASPGSQLADPKAWEYFCEQHLKEHGFIPSYRDSRAQDLYSMFKSGRIYELENTEHTDASR